MDMIKLWLKEHGVWGIIFIVYSALIAYLNFGGLMSSYQITEMSVVIGWVLIFVYIFVGGFFYSLGWKKRLYSKKASNIIFSFIIATSVLFCVLSVYLSLPQLMAQLRLSAGEDALESTLRINAILFASIIYFLIYLVLNMPVICSYFKYKKHYEELKEVKKPYWKLFLTFFAALSLINMVFLLLYTDKSQLNIFDYPVMFSGLLDAVILVGYAYNLKMGKKFIWQALMLPYIIFHFLVYSFASEHLLMMSKLQLTYESIATLVANVISFVTFFYVYYRYAFTKDVYADETENTKN